MTTGFPDNFISYDSHDCDSVPSSLFLKLIDFLTKDETFLENTNSPTESDTHNLQQPFEEQRRAITPQSKTKNAPGHLKTIVIKGLRHCLNSKDGMDIECIRMRYDALSKEKRTAIKAYVKSNDPTKKTWNGIKMTASKYDFVVDILRDMIVDLLSDQNYGDLRSGLLHSKMIEKTKTIILQERDKLREDALKYLVLV